MSTLTGTHHHHLAESHPPAEISVLLSMLTLVPGVVGGTEVFATELTRALQRRSDCTVDTFMNATAGAAHPDLPSIIDRTYSTSSSTHGRLLAMARTSLDGRRRRATYGLNRFDVVHYPLTIPIPSAGSAASVVTLHDLQHIYFPQYFSRLERQFRRVAYHRSARNATRVVTSSNHSADSITEFLGIDRDRIDVAYLGVDHAIFAPSTEPKEPFLYFPANAWPHKNHARLFEAFADVRTEHPELRLILTGGMHERLRLPDGVTSLGYVSRSEVADLYRRASALVYPSLFEGFGLPPIEAMASGCPVVASHEGSLGEICGSAARKVDATDPADIALGIVDVLADPGLWSARGLTHAAGFTWDACANAHVATYRRALDAA
jgi:glycosyltransferase involved in cell wall biosynthesis